MKRVQVNHWQSAARAHRSNTTGPSKFQVRIQIGQFLHLALAAMAKHDTDAIGRSANPRPFAD